MENTIKELIEEYFENSISYKLIDLGIRGERSNKIVEVYIDNEQGVEIDELSKINHELNEMMDSRYEGNDISKLVVSSPGVERPFKFIWQLKKHQGRIVEITMSNDEKIEGKLLEVHDESEKYIFIDTVQTSDKKKKPGAGGKDPVLHKIYFPDIKESRIKISI